MWIFKSFVMNVSFLSPKNPKLKKNFLGKAELPSSNQYEYLARKVSDRMGGPSDTILENSESHLEELRKNIGNAVPLGSIRLGVCRHRAILFKVVCDYLGLKSRLVRGKMEDCPHAWNIIKQNEEYHLVDVMNSPDRLLKEGEKKIPQKSSIE